MRSFLLLAALVLAISAAPVVRQATGRQAADISIDKTTPTPVPSPPNSPPPSASPPNSPPPPPPGTIPPAQPTPPTASTAPTPSSPPSASSPSPTATPPAAGPRVEQQATRRNNTGAIVGGIIGGLILLLLLVLLLWFLVFRKRDSDSAGATGASAGASGGSGPSGAARAAAAGAAGAGAAGGAAVAAGAAARGADSDTTIQDIELAEAEAALPDNYVVSDTARHHGGVPAGAAAAGGAAAALAALDKSGGGPVPRGPSPPPHDYVVGAGPIASRTDFEDIRDRFARDEIGDRSAVLGEHMPPALEAGASANAPLLSAPEPSPAPPVSAPAAAAAAAAAAPPTAPAQEPVQPEAGDTLPDRPAPLGAEGPDNTPQDRSGSVSEAAQSLTGRSAKDELAESASFDRDPVSATGNKQDHE